MHTKIIFTSAKGVVFIGVILLVSLFVSKITPLQKKFGGQGAGRNN